MKSIALIAPEKRVVPAWAKRVDAASATVVGASLMRREHDATGLNAKS
ncbi:hypothetical protein [Paraburkholderia xenovorans]